MTKPEERKKNLLRRQEKESSNCNFNLNPLTSSFFLSLCDYDSQHVAHKHNLLLRIICPIPHIQAYKLVIVLCNLFTCTCVIPFALYVDFNPLCVVL